MARAKKVFTMYGKHSNVVTYEYRGREYDVEYPTNWTYCVTSPKVQHMDAQAKIDAELDNPVPEADGEAFNLDEVWELMGW